MATSFNAKARKDAAKKALERLEQSDPQRAFVQYAQQGDAAGVARLLQSAEVDVNAIVLIDTGVETVEDTALHAAAGAGHLDVAQMLIAAGADVNVKVNDQETPLIQAAMNGWPLMVGMLLQHKADIDHAESYDGHTALHWASRLGRSTTVETLLAAGANESLKSKHGETAREMICAQIGMGKNEYQEIFDAVEGAFLKAAAQRARAQEQVRAEEANMAKALADAPVLQKEIAVGKPLRLKPRRP